MNYEQRYKEALEKTKKVYHDHRKDRYWRDWLTELFPELKESEEERIKKELIDFLRLPHPQFVGERDHELWIAWIEKQTNKD